MLNGWGIMVKFRALLIFIRDRIANTYEGTPRLIRIWSEVAHAIVDADEWTAGQ